MNLKKFLIGAMPALMLASCASDEPTVNNDRGEGGSTYAKIRLQLTTATRSGTVDYDDPTNSEDGFEIGQVYENTINDVTLVLATYDNVAGTYKPVATSTKGVVQPDANPSDQPAQNPVYTIMFQDEDIVSLHGQKVYVFAYCNSSVGEADIMAASDLALMEGVINNPDRDDVWKSGGFLMVNAPNKGVPSVTLPAEEELINDYNTPEKALDLGVVNVSRVASRFDFKQVNGNVYSIFNVNDASDKIAEIQLLAMAPINIAKDYYYLPRVSEDGQTPWTVCGIERPDNWVVSPNYADKTPGNALNLLSNYLYQAYGHNYGDETYYSYTAMAAFDKMDDDNDENWGTNMQGGNAGYKIWRYVSENTLPSISGQVKGLSTGVVFKAEILNPKAESNMAVAMEAKKAVYAYNGTYYGDVEALRAVVAKMPESSTMRKDFEKVFGAESLIIDEDTKEFKNPISDCTPTANDGTFKILRPTIGSDGAAHYYVYYVYYNRHNDNGVPTQMSTMEFATVRNNIYKLAVTSISDFGHTSDPGDDPDPENPGDPDEEPKTYFKVSCRVVPWMVRVNNIEF